MANLQQEIWKDIKGFEGQYQVSNLGRVKSLDRYCRYKKTEHLMFKKGTLLKPAKVNGYPKVRLSDGQGNHVMRRVHRLVAAAFVPNTNNYPVVNHIDGIKDNAAAYNLEWVEQADNVGHAWKTGLSKKPTVIKKGKEWSFSKPVAQYDKSGKLIRIWDCVNDAAKEYNGSLGNICKVAAGRKNYNSAYGFVWKYVEKQVETKQLQQTNK